MGSSLLELDRWFKDRGSALLGYSGGVDSALLAVVGARALEGRFLAVIGRSASLSTAQWEQAEGLARARRIPLLELSTTELDDPGYRRNGPDRCFHCKQELWTKLGAVARERGFEVLIDGTHLDDFDDHRPGQSAGRLAGVRSPLVELGWTKTRVREAARGLGLPIWDAPSAPCLASRVQYGLPVTEERLSQVERAEDWLRARGIEGNLRVRHLGSSARVEVDPEAFEALDSLWLALVDAFRDIGFSKVVRDPAGYRRGSLLAS